MTHEVEEKEERSEFIRDHCPLPSAAEQLMCCSGCCRRCQVTCLLHTPDCLMVLQLCSKTTKGVAEISPNAIFREGTYQHILLVESIYWRIHTIN